MLRVSDGDGDAAAPVDLHDAAQRQTLAALLISPELVGERRGAADDRFAQSVWAQAVLPDRLGGVQLACADAVCESAFVAGFVACLVYVREHA